MVNMIPETGMHYSDFGEGPPLVFVHALGLNTGMWSLQVPVLAQRYRVIRYDVRGHGLTPYSPEPLTIHTLASDLATLMDTLGLEQAAIIGISMGGMIAQAFASNYPERAAALVLVSSASVFPEAGRAGLKERARLAAESGMAPMVAPAIDRWFTGQFKAKALDNPLASTGGGPDVPEALRLNRYAYEAGIVAAISQMILGTDPRGYAACCLALAETDITPDLHRIKCPTLVMSGAEDPTLSVESQENLAVGISQSTRLVVEDSSHLVPIEQAEEFNNHLLNFLGWCNY